MIKRRDPDPMFIGVPCSMVAVGTATGAMPPSPFGLHKDGYLSLDYMNRYARMNLSIRRRVQFKRGERPALKDFLEENTEKCIVCVLGHYIYADGNTYWSFQRNAQDKVVSVWYLWR